MGFHILKCSCGEKHHLPQRIIVAIMSLLGILVAYGQRISLNLAITTMTDKKVSQSKSCPPRNSSISFGSKNISGGVMDWSNQEQNYILSAFYPGYIIGHVPAGFLGDRYGARWVFCTGILLSTATVLLTPIIVVNTPWWVTYILRSVMGLGQSVIYPSISVLFAKWIPKQERSTLGAFSFAANSLGVIFGNLLTGMIIKAVGNWPFGFYVWGFLGGVWCLFIVIYVFSEPETHPFITDREKQKLSAEIPKSDHGLKMPWRAIFMDYGFWALIVSEIGHDFTIFTLANNFPKYLSDVLHYDLAENSLASSLPYIGQWLGGIIFGEIIDYLIKKKGVSIILMRRVATTIGSIPPAAFILAAAYMGCNGTLVIVMFGINLFFKGVLYCGMKINHLDMSVNFAGILMALTNGVGAIAGWVSPLIINVIAPDNELEQWQIVFWVVFAVAFLTNLFYVFFCKAERQVWDVGPDEMDEFLKQKEAQKAAKEKEKQEKKAAKQAKKDAKRAGAATPGPANT